MTQAELYSRNTFFDRMSEYPKTSTLASLSLGVAASGLLYYLNERRKQEARARSQQVAQARERIQRFKAYNEVTGLSFYIHTSTSNEEIPDREVSPKLMRNLDPVNIIYPRAK